MSFFQQHWENEPDSAAAHFVKITFNVFNSLRIVLSVATITIVLFCGIFVPAIGVVKVLTECRMIGSKVAAPEISVFSLRLCLKRFRPLWFFPISRIAMEYQSQTGTLS